MRKIKIILVLLMMSVSGFGQTIISQNADSTGLSNEVGDTVSDAIEVQSTIIKERASDKRIKEPKTLISNNIKNRTYGAAVFSASTYKNRTMLLAGAKGAWVVHNTLGLGFELNGIIPTAKYKGVDPSEENREVRVLGGYGGLMLEPVFFGNRMIHFTVPISVGAGWLGYDISNDALWDHHDDYDEELIDDDVFWYFQSGINLEMNLTRKLRLDVGVFKRFAQDLELLNTDADDFDQVTYSMAIKFGLF